MIREFIKGEHDKIGDNFYSSDFDCHCTRPECKVTYIDSALIEYLDAKVRKWKRIPTIVSGFRCTAHNRSVGGKPGSFHLIGQAADIKVPGMTPTQVQKDCEDAKGLGRYKTFTHVDTRMGKSRWKG